MELGIKENTGGGSGDQIGDGRMVSQYHHNKIF
jgi:hypothetical protein